MKMTRMIMGAALLFAAAVFTGCRKEAGAVPQSTEEITAQVKVTDNATIREGILLVGIRSGSSPYITKDEQGKIEGFEVDLANAIGELTMLEVKFVEMEYIGIYAELDAGQYDCVISGVQISEEVDKVYDFSAPYYTDGEGGEYGIVVKTGNNRLLNVLNQSISILTENGTMDGLYDKWFTDGEQPEIGTEDKAGQDHERVN